MPTRNNMERFLGGIEFHLVGSTPQVKGLLALLQLGQQNVIVNIVLTDSQVINTIGQAVRSKQFRAQALAYKLLQRHTEEQCQTVQCAIKH